MPRLNWDAINERFYETGVSHGVVYIKKDPDVNESNPYTEYRPGVVWNGLIDVTKSNEGFESSVLEASGFVYDILRTPERLTGSIEAFTYPTQFADCFGLGGYSAGVYMGQQRHKMFGLCYRSEVSGGGYILHVIYNCTANLDEDEYTTMSDNIEAKTFHWDFDCIPMEIDNFDPFCDIMFDSRLIPTEKMGALEDMLYGNATGYASLPRPEVLLGIVNSGSPMNPYPTDTLWIHVSNEFLINVYVDGETLVVNASSRV